MRFGVAGCAGPRMSARPYRSGRGPSLKVLRDEDRSSARSSSMLCTHSSAQSPAALQAQKISPECCAQTTQLSQLPACLLSQASTTRATPQCTALNAMRTWLRSAQLHALLLCQVSRSKNRRPIHSSTACLLAMSLTPASTGCNSDAVLITQLISNASLQCLSVKPALCAPLQRVLLPHSRLLVRGLRRQIVRQRWL